MTAAPLTIRVPGSTSNLGAGFDVLGLAVDLHIELTVSVRAAGDGVEWIFVDASPSGGNAIARGFDALVGASGSTASIPALRVEVTSEIPMKGGLGSSAAAIVAGLRLAERFVGARPADELIALATSLEGHPDNVSASLLGGLTVSAAEPDGRVTSIPLEWPGDWELLVATPRLELDTKTARAALPAAVPLADAVANLQRVGLLVAAVATRNATALGHCFADRLHQPYRAALVPGLSQALAFSRPAIAGIFLSGAGPSIAAVMTEPDPAVEALFGTMYDRLGLEATLRRLRIVQPF